MMMTPQGQVKITDFGLAQVGYLTRITNAGSSLGTPAYMSPEQAQGDAVDRRTDIWSLGVVLHEMIAGRLPFRGETDQAIAYGIVHVDPEPLSALRSGIPLLLDRVVEKAVAKDPGDRYQHAADLAVDLRRVQRELSGERSVLSPSVKAARLRSVWIAMGFLLAAILGALAATLLRKPPAVPPSYTLTQLTRDSGLTFQPVLSADGKFVAYSSDRGNTQSLDIWLHQVGGGQPVQLTTHEADDTSPDFSPDGTKIVFHSGRDGGGIYTMPALGGPQKLLASGGSYPRFSPDGAWVAYSVGGPRRSAKIHIVPSNGGPAKQLDLGIPWAMAPVWSPDGNRLLFIGNQDEIGSRPPYNWWVAPKDGGNPVNTGADAAFQRAKLDLRYNLSLELAPPVWRSEDQVVFSARSGGSTNIWEFDLRKQTLRQLTNGTGEYTPSMTRTGGLSFSTIESNGQIWALPLDANSAKVSGQPYTVAAGTADYLFPTVPRDGRTLVYISNKFGTNDVWVKDLDTGAENALVSTPLDESRAIISPDGSKVVFGRRENEVAEIFVIPSKGGIERKIVSGASGLMGWSSDGRKVVYTWGRPFTFRTVDVSSGAVVELIRHPKRSVDVVRFSPDDRWIAFKLELQPGYETTFISPVRNGIAAAEAEWIQITDKGVDGRVWWSPDGNLLYFVSNRDGSTGCIWARRLHPRTKAPDGPVFEIRHFRGGRETLRFATFGYGMANDRLLFSVHQTRSNIWLGHPRQ